MNKLYTAIIILTLLSCEETPEVTPRTLNVSVGEEVTLSNPLLDEGDRFEWLFDDGKSSTLESPTYIYNSAGRYIVTLKVWKGNKFKGSFTVKYVNVKPYSYPLPSDIMVSSYNLDNLYENTEFDVEIIFPDYVDLSNTPVAFSYLWDIGSGENIVTTTPYLNDYQYTEMGDYEIVVDIQNQFGDAITFSKIITVLDDTTTINARANVAGLTTLVNPQPSIMLIYRSDLSLLLDKFSVDDYPGPLATSVPLFDGGKFVFGNFFNDVNHYDHHEIIDPTEPTFYPYRYPAQYSPGSSIENRVIHIMYIQLGDNGYHFYKGGHIIQPGELQNVTLVPVFTNY